MKTYILVSEKNWHIKLFENLKKIINANWLRIDSKDTFTSSYLHSIKPDKIFIPHWSYLIPAIIYEHFKCIVFHMTDLPYGRGGSPLQNLIVRGHDKTKISAIKVSRGMDTGPVYLKGDLDLAGTAEEVFIRSSKVIEKMIFKIVTNDPEPVAQQGEVVEFKRRKPEDGNMAGLNQISEVYDFIRMLDCEGYPPAFIENANFKFDFTRASLKADDTIIADVSINNIPTRPPGEITEFKRIKPEESSIDGLSELQKVYDHIKLRHSAGYPHAFIETDHFKFEFTRAWLKGDESILADVRIIKK